MPKGKPKYSKILLDGTFYPKIPSLCECLNHCNIILWNGNRFVNGHNSIGSSKSQDVRDKIGRGNNGKISPRKGIPLTKEHKQNLSKSLKGKSSKTKGIPRPLEVRKKIGDAQSGSKNHMFGKTTSQKQKETITKRDLTDNPMCQPESIGMFAKESNPNWRGGISTLPYCHKWTSTLRESIRLRDSHICQLCGKTQEQNTKRKQQMTVHHIHHDKSNCYPDCITLCCSCNTSVENKDNKRYYEDLFMNNLNNRQLLFWTRR